MKNMKMRKFLRGGKRRPVTELTPIRNWWDTSSKEPWRPVLQRSWFLTIPVTGTGADVML